MTSAYIGLGANLGDPRAQLLAAVEALDRTAGTCVTARSSLYRSSPVGYADQPHYLNAVVRLDTSLEPEALLARLQEIERTLGRERPFRDAPRTIDLDLLLYGAGRLDTPTLSVPHPRMHQRAFVLLPLLELDPAAVIPGRGSAIELLRGCAAQAVERIQA